MEQVIGLGCRVPFLQISVDHPLRDLLCYLMGEARGQSNLFFGHREGLAEDMVSVQVLDFYAFLEAEIFPCSYVEDQELVHYSKVCRCLSMNLVFDDSCLVGRDHLVLVSSHYDLMDESCGRRVLVFQTYH